MQAGRPGQPLASPLDCWQNSPPWPPPPTRTIPTVLVSPIRLLTRAVVVDMGVAPRPHTLLGRKVQVGGGLGSCKVAGSEGGPTPYSLAAATLNWYLQRLGDREVVRSLVL